MSGVLALEPVEPVERHLPQLDDRTRNIKKREQFAKMEALQSVFLEEAVQQRNPQAAMVAIKCAELLADLAGLNAPRPSTIDMKAIEQPSESGTDRLRRAIAHVVAEGKAKRAREALATGGAATEDAPERPAA